MPKSKIKFHDVEECLSLFSSMPLSWREEDSYGSLRQAVSEARFALLHGAGERVHANGLGSPTDEARIFITDEAPYRYYATSGGGRLSCYADALARVKAETKEVGEPHEVVRLIGLLYGPDHTDTVLVY